MVWWAWINTTWLANWLDPGSTRVHLLLVAAALLALLLAAAIPGALDEHGLLFAASYVGLQAGRNLSATLLAPAGHHLRRTFARLLFWSAIAGVVWIAGAFVEHDLRLLVWGLALSIDLVAPIAGYPTPGLGRTHPDDYDVDGPHFADILIVAGIIVVAVSDDLLIAHPLETLDAIGAATVLGGPALFLLGDSLFRYRMIGSFSRRRLGCIAALVVTGVIAARVPVLALMSIATAMLVALAVSETYVHGTGGEA